MHILQLCACEFIVAGLNVASTCFINSLTENGPLGMAVYAAFMIATQLYIFGMVSGGHGNPGITYLSYELGNYAFQTAMFVIVSQFLGAMAGYFTLQILMEGAENALGDCCIAQCNEVTMEQMLFIEFICTWMWMLAWCATWDCRNKDLRRTSHIRMGWALAALHFAAVKYTGASFNPARTIATGILNNNYEFFWQTLGTQILAIWLAMIAWMYVFPMYQCKLVHCPACPRPCEEGVLRNRHVQLIPSRRIRA